LIDRQRTSKNILFSNAHSRELTYSYSEVLEVACVLLTVLQKFLDYITSHSHHLTWSYEFLFIGLSGTAR